MRTFLTLSLGELDRPLVTVDPEGDGERSMTIRISEEATIIGDADDVLRWVRELAAQVAMRTGE